MSSYKALLRQKIESMKQNGAFHIVLGSFMTKFVSFFGSIFIVRLLSKTDYGILSYYENFVSYFIVLAGFGLDAALLRYMVLSDGMPAKKGCKPTNRRNAVFLLCIFSIKNFLTNCQYHSVSYSSGMP